MLDYPRVVGHAAKLDYIHQLLHAHDFAADSEQYGLAEPLPMWQVVREAEGPSGRPRLVKYCRQQDDHEFLVITLDIPSLFWSLRYETGELRAKGCGYAHLARLLKRTPKVLPR